MFCYYSSLTIIINIQFHLYDYYYNYVVIWQILVKLYNKVPFVHISSLHLLARDDHAQYITFININANSY